jgi:predicted permease
MSFARKHYSAVGTAETGTSRPRRGGAWDPLGAVVRFVPEGPEQFGWTMAAILQDLRYAVRMFAKNPGFSAIVGVTLALGVAGNIVIFSIFNAFYLRPFPFVEPGRLVDLDETAPRWNLEFTGLSYPEFDGWRQNNRSFEGMGAWKGRDYNASFQGMAERVGGARVTHDLAAVLRLQPTLGRFFTPDEDRPGGAKVVVLGHGFWQRQFGGKAEVIGQTLRLDHTPFTIIGVLPPADHLLVEGDFWVPLAFDPQVEQGWMLRGVGRLRNGVTLGMAREDLRGVHQGLIENHRANENVSPRITPLSERFFGPALGVIRLLLGAVGVVLLIACGNVAALMLARGLGRARELGLRASLGATPWQLGRLIAVETLLLALLGGLLGLALGRWGLHVLLGSLVDQTPPWLRFDLDWRVGLSTSLMVLMSAVVGGLPVIRSALKADLHAVVQSSTQQSTSAGAGRRSLHALVVAEVALTLVLMVQGALLLQAFRSLQRIDPGYRPMHVLVCQIALPENQYASPEARVAFFGNLLERVRNLPGVVAASAVSAPPLGGHWGNFFTLENAPPRGANEPDPVVLQRIAFPAYFETMGIPLLAGRSFTAQDGTSEGSRAVIVNETFARRFWPGQDPVGKRISHRYPNAPWMTVVGVARDVKHYGVDQPMIPGVYLPFAQNSLDQMAIVIRTSGAPTALAPTFRALVRESDPDLAVFGVASMEQQFVRSMWVRRLTLSLFAIFAGVALTMAVGGIYGVFSYVVGRRTQEIGVRLAMGAAPGAVLWLMLRHGLALAGVGVGLGLTGALAVAPFTRALLLDVSPADPLTLAGVALLLTGVALLACWVPARRAANIDPLAALRSE